MITRADGKSALPHGDVMMKSGDKILMICDQSMFDDIWKTLVEK
jgi:Trk K+ transport system NAD-binding subunit